MGYHRVSALCVIKFLSSTENVSYSRLWTYEQIMMAWPRRCFSESINIGGDMRYSHLATASRLSWHARILLVRIFDSDCIKTKRSSWYKWHATLCEPPLNVEKTIVQYHRLFLCRPHGNHLENAIYTVQMNNQLVHPSRILSLIARSGHTRLYDPLLQQAFEFRQVCLLV